MGIPDKFRTHCVARRTLFDDLDENFMVPRQIQCRQRMRRPSSLSGPPHNHIRQLPSQLHTRLQVNSHLDGFHQLQDQCTCVGFPAPSVCALSAHGTRTNTSTSSMSPPSLLSRQRSAFLLMDHSSVNGNQNCTEVYISRGSSFMII